jgi:phospholipase/carboxylesterase
VADAPLPPGVHPLGLGDARDGLIYVPDVDGAPPLLVFLHGATMNARQTLRPLVSAADDAGLALLVPESRGETWDVILGTFGPDVKFIDAALERALYATDVDGDRLSIGGVSDGASYALSLGIANGDRFGRVIAFSPGFAAPPEQVGSPRMFISHGLHDRVLPIDRCSRPLVASLREGGYDVEYREFDGGHEMPEPIVRAAFMWATKRLRG